MLTSKIIDGDNYELLPVFSVIYNSDKKDNYTFLDNCLKEKELTPIWREDYLEKILEYHERAKRLFNSDKVGLIYLVNNHEVDIPLLDYKFEKGDKIDIAYISN